MSYIRHSWGDYEHDEEEEEDIDQSLPERPGGDPVETEEKE